MFNKHQELTKGQRNALMRVELVMQECVQSNVFASDLAFVLYEISKTNSILEDALAQVSEKAGWAGWAG